MKFPSPPQSVEELMARAKALAGLSLESVANSLETPLPTSLSHNKGQIGQLLELALGASAQSKALPDFPQLGIELKTVPLNHALQPKESTFVCTAPFNITQHQRHWLTSHVRNKLQKVLWIPIEANPKIALAERRIATPILWIMQEPYESILQNDWEELMDKLLLGNVDQITAHQGQYLQIRPKAANASEKVWVINQAGERVQVGPKGFYLRCQFTAQILQETTRQVIEPAHN